jgi:hypothetical protein
MSTMIDIAGRIIIGASTLALLLMGLRMVIHRDPVRFDRRIRLIGSLLLAANAAFVFWLVVIRNGHGYF